MSHNFKYKYNKYYKKYLNLIGGSPKIYIYFNKQNVKYYLHSNLSFNTNKYGWLYQNNNIFTYNRNRVLDSWDGIKEGKVLLNEPNKHINQTFSIDGDSIIKKGSKLFLSINDNWQLGIGKKFKLLVEVDKLIIPKSGKGRIINNKGFWVIQITNLYDKNKTNYGIDQNKLLRLATQELKKKGKKLNIPTSHGVGAHISLNQNQKQKLISLENQEVVFNITDIAQYQDNSYWVVLTVELLNKHLDKTDWSSFHISIGQAN